MLSLNCTIFSEALMIWCDCSLSSSMKAEMGITHMLYSSFTAVLLPDCPPGVTIAVRFAETHPQSRGMSYCADPYHTRMRSLRNHIVLSGSPPPSSVAPRKNLTLTFFGV